MPDPPPHESSKVTAFGDRAPRPPAMTEEAVAGLLHDVHPETVARRLGSHIGKPTLSPAEREVAGHVLRVMLDDATVQVRHIIAETLKSSPFLPHEIAVALANDVETVALPILAFSAVLTDDDLIAVIEAGSSLKQIAVAGRAQVQANVAEAIVGTVNGAAVAMLVTNQGAVLDDAALDRVATRFACDPRVAYGLRQRPNLPLQIAERLVAFTVESLRGFIAAHANLSPETVDQLVLRTREAATLDLITPNLPAAEAVQLAEHLYEVGRLTPSLVLRALCLGDLGLFEAGMSRLAGIPIHNARLLIHDSGSRGLSSLAERAGMPAAYVPALKAGLGYVSEMLAQGMDYDRIRFRGVMVERMLSRCDGPVDSLLSADIDYLLIRLSEPKRLAA